MTQGVGGLGTGGLMTKSCPKCGFQVESTVEQCPRDGTDLNPIVTDPIFVQKFRYLGKIGSGGMGVIYKAKHLILDKTVAIKMIHGHMSSAEALQRFLIEGRATSLLSHPNIVAVHDLGTTTAGHPYMVMDYVEGKTLADVFANEPPLTIDRFLNIFIKVCDALSHAHGKSILHRDLKPSNIMLVRDDDGLETVKIMDFGIAKLLDDTDSGAQRLTKTGDAIGSPVYMSPEQAQGVRLDGRCDLYSLGCVMFEALAGVPPFTGATPLETLMMHIQDQPPTIEQASLGKKTDPRLESIVIKLLQKDPDVRYASMDDLKQDLVNYHELIPSATKLKPDATLARPQTGSQMHSWRVPLIATGVLVIGLVLSGVFFTTPFLKRPQSNNQPTVEKTQKPPVFVNAAGPKEDSPEENSKTSAPDHSKADLMSDDVGALIQQRALRGDQKIELNAIGFVKPLKDSDLEPLKDADQLRELAIANSEITDKGLECLKKVPLTSLNISNTKVRDLSPLAHQLQLDSLNASKDEISDNGFQVIAGLKSLRLLKINHTRLDDAQLKKLSSLKNLRELEISPCPHVTTAGVAEFKKLLPKCKVAYSQNQDIYQTKGWADLDKAQSAERRSDWLEAERSYKDCMESEEERFEESQKIDYDLAVRSAVGMAQCEEKLGDYLHAVKICQDTLNHLKRRKAPAFALAQLIFQKASAEEKAGRRDSSLRSRLEADKYFGEALEKTTDPGTRRLAAENKLQEAIDYSEAERPAAGADALTQASALCKPLTETIESYPTAFEKVAGAFAMQNRQDKALYLFGEAEKYYKAHPKLNPGTNRLDLKRALGDSYYAQKKYAEAIPYLKEVVDSSAIPLTVRKSRCAFLVDALNKNHNMGEAARYSKKFR
jgi:serine/threonine-protein kinase